MNLRYININQLCERFKKHNLNMENIYDFMNDSSNEEENDYLLKCYLLSTLENYKHIDELVKYYPNCVSSPAMQIINRCSDKPFWNFVSNEKNTTMNYNSYEDLIELLYKFIILYLDLNSVEVNVNQYESLKIFNEKKKKYEELLEIIIKKYGNILERKNIRLNDFIAIRMALKTSDKKTISDAFELFLNKDVYASKLKYDLLYNYKIITSIFNSNFIREDNVENLLKKIRNLMLDEDITMYNMTKEDNDEFLNCPVGEEVNSSDYRTIDLKESNKSNDFFSNISPSSDIKTDMSNLINEYDKIKQIKDDEEYVIESYRFTMRLLQIHPYYNGNGRTARYLFYALLLKRNILPPTVTDSYDCGKCYYDSNIQDKYISMRYNVMDSRLKNK